jgi:hypothetical protein
MTPVRRTSRVAVGTVASRHFLPMARVLTESLRQFHPDVPFVLALAEPESTPPGGIQWCEAVPIDALGLPSLREYRFQYTLSQIVISAKAYLLRYLLDRGFDRAVFLDCDILVLGDISSLLWPPEEASIQLTPHLLDPIGAARGIDDELTILKSGVFNGGFIGVAESSAARRFLDWFQRRLTTDCRHDLQAGLHNDQRWLDLAPALFPATRIERDPGANVAYWNLHERRVTVDGGEDVRVNGAPARFFHFSGYDPAEPRLPSRYRPALCREHLGAARILFDRYTALTKAAGWSERLWPDRAFTSVDAFATFDNGMPIPPIVRRIFQAEGGADGRFGDPFRTTGPGSFFRWLHSMVDGIPQLWRSVHALRPDLRSAYPDLAGRDRNRFIAWAASSGASELGLTGFPPDPAPLGSGTDGAHAVSPSLPAS